MNCCREVLILGTFSLPLSSISLHAGAGDVVLKAPCQISPCYQKHDSFALSEKQNMSRKGGKELMDTPAASDDENQC